MALTRFTLGGFLVRLLLSATLVLLTYNPTEFSYIHWVRNSLMEDRLGAAHALAGVVVLAGWVVLVRASYRSLGRIGVFLGAAFFGTLVWFLLSMGWLAMGSERAITWTALLCLSALLALGVSWSHVRRRLTGQVDVDDVDVVE